PQEEQMGVARPAGSAPLRPVKSDIQGAGERARGWLRPAQRSGDYSSEARLSWSSVFKPIPLSRPTIYSTATDRIKRQNPYFTRLLASILLHSPAGAPYVDVQCPLAGARAAAALC